MSANNIEFEVVAEGLLFPEGPVAMADGSVLYVDMLAGTLERAWNGRKQVVAQTGGGPNGVAIGGDGAAYLCNNGGFAWSRDSEGALSISGLPSADYDGGRIERIDLATGRIERIIEAVDGHRLSSPNDIVFDATGGFWFTDIGKIHQRSRDISGIYYAAAGGIDARQMIYGGVSYNGVGLSPDGGTLYAADTHSGTLFAWDLLAPGVLDGTPRRSVARMRAGVELDSLAVEESGTVCVGMIYSGGIARIQPNGSVEEIAINDRYVTNIAFGGADRRDAYITLSETGKVVKTRWPAPGLMLNFGA